MQLRKRPICTTTIDPAMYELLRDEAKKDERPLSFVLDRALHVWALSLGTAKEPA
jgi:hypothetical protein